MRLQKITKLTIFTVLFNAAAVCEVPDNALLDLFVLVKEGALTESEAMAAVAGLKDGTPEDGISEDALFELFLLVKQGVLTEDEAIAAVDSTESKDVLLELFVLVKKGVLTESEATTAAIDLEGEASLYAVPDDVLANLFSLIKKGGLTAEEAITMAAGLPEKEQIALPESLGDEAPVYVVSKDALLDLFALVKEGTLTEDEAILAASDLKKEATLSLTAKGKQVQDLKIKGRLHMQYDNLSNDAGESAQNGFYFRRVRLGAEAKFFDDFYGDINVAFGGNDDARSVENAVIAWEYDSKTKFEAGYTKVPFGYYEVISSAKIKTVERSIANRYFIEGDGLRFAGRLTGLFVEGELEKGFSYAAALVSSDASNSREDAKVGSGNGLASFVRLEWKDEDLLLGMDLGIKQDGSDFAGGNGDIFGYGFHANYITGKHTVNGEILGAVVEDEGSTEDDINVFGFTLLYAYEVNDKWEAVTSYSIIDTGNANLLDADDLVRRSNVKTSSAGAYSAGNAFYIGFNHFIVDNDLKLSGGYEFAEFDSSSVETRPAEEVEINGIRLRLQILF